MIRLQDLFCLGTVAIAGIALSAIMSRTKGHTASSVVPVSKGPNAVASVIEDPQVKMQANICAVYDLFAELQPGVEPPTFYEHLGVLPRIPGAGAASPLGGGNDRNDGFKVSVVRATSQKLLSLFERERIETDEAVHLTLKLERRFLLRSQEVLLEDSMRAMYNGKFMGDHTRALREFCNWT